MSLSIAEKTVVYVGLIGFGGLLINIAICLHIAYTKMDLMLLRFKNSPYVMSHVFYLNTGPSGRLIFLGVVTAVLMRPHKYLSDGRAFAEDIQYFPIDLKNKLIKLHWSGVALLLLILGIAVVAKFEIV